MPQKTLKTERELQDLVRGCTFLGTGGGGSPDEGFAALKTAFEAKGSIKWVDVKNVADDAWTACPYGMGSIAPRTPQVLRMMRALGLTRVRVQRKLVQVIKELEAYKGIKIEALVPVEIGGFNTPDPLAAGTTLNIPVVDGDYSGGRSIPEIVQTTPYIYEKNMLPIASVDEWGNVCIIKNAVNYFMGEKIGKLIASAAYGLAGNCAFLMKGKEMKQIATTNTLTEALHIGVAIRQAREKGKSPVEAAVKATGGWLLF
ncbi:MAG: DUF917 domain-containing protein, partial [Candidatus Bathyarchaeia archaeon]